MTKRLDGKRAVVTGAGSGMGRAMALLFAREGARVCAADVSADGLGSLAAEASLEDLAIEPYAINLINVSEIAPMIDEVCRSWGGLDILVNNAGVMDRFEGVGSLSLDVWHRVLTIDLEAPMHAMRAAVPIMLQQGRGTILNISSAAGVSGAAAGAAYTAAKHGLVGLTRNTAWVYAKQGIRCNAILPGAVETGIGATMQNMAINEEGHARASGYHALCPIKLMPDDIAQAALFLVSDDAVHVNGVLMPVDAGWSAA